MAKSEAQARADAKYRKEKVKQHNLKFFPAEYDFYSHMKAQGNSAAYIKALIRADLENKQKQGGA